MGHILIMRWVTIVAVSLLGGCASTHSEEPFVRYEVRLDELLKARPSDPDLLFLRHHQKDLVRCLELARLRPTPLVLASVVSEFMGAGLDEKNLPEFRRLLQAWIDSDPDNSMPVVLKAQIAISDGDLEEGAASIVHSSELARCAAYSLEAQRETYRIQRKIGFDDIYFLGAVLQRSNYQLTSSMLGACTLLSTLAFEYELRGNFEKSRACTKANMKLALKFLDSNSTCLDRSLGLDRAYEAAVRLCELMLMKGDESAAGEAAEQARRCWRESESLRLAIRRDMEENPLKPAFVEAGMLKEEPESEDDPMSGLLDTVSGITNATDDTWRRFREAVRKREGEIRPYYENQLRKGTAVAALELLTDEDRSALASMKPPLDFFWDRRSDFYHAVSTAAELDLQISWLVTPQTGLDDDVRDFMSDRAFHSLLHNGRGKNLPKLEEALESKDGTNWLVAVILVASGYRNPRLSDKLPACVDEYNPGTCWAAAKLGLKQVIPDLIQTFSIDLWPGRVYHRFDEAVTVYFALRDISGKDFGFNSATWEEWARSEGLMKKDD